MEDELISLDKNYTWYLFKLPTGKKALYKKQVLRVKDEIEDTKRYIQGKVGGQGVPTKRGVDYNKICFIVVKMAIITMVLGIVASKDLHLEQLDVKTAFLHGNII